MTHAELLAAMREDLGDGDAMLFSDTALARCLTRALYAVAQDLGQSMTLVNGEIVPTPEGLTAELLLLLAESHACGIMRGKTANAVNITSGDKRVERTNQAKSWGDLEADLLAQYRARVAALTGGDLFLTPPPLRPVLYEQGSEVIEYERYE